MVCLELGVSIFGTLIGGSSVISSSKASSEKIKNISQET